MPTGVIHPGAPGGTFLTKVGRFEVSRVQLRSYDWSPQKGHCEWDDQRGDRSCYKEGPKEVLDVRLRQEFFALVRLWDSLMRSHVILMKWIKDDQQHLCVQV